MAYVSRVLADRESVIYVARFHWLYLFVGAFPLIVIFVLIYGVKGIRSVQDGLDALVQGLEQRAPGDVSQVTDLVPLALAGLGLFAALFLIQRLIDVFTTEMVVTDRRSILKKGLISRDVSEIRLDRVESVEINQTVLGRIFNYGRVIVHGTGVGAISFPSLMAEPLKFRSSIEGRRAARTPAAPAPVQAPAPPVENEELIEELRSRIAALENDNKDLREEVDKLEEQVRALLGLENDALREENALLRRMMTENPEAGRTGDGKKG